MIQSILQSYNPAILQSQALRSAAARGVVGQFGGHAGIAVFARGREFQHSRHLALAADRTAWDVSVHVAVVRDAAGVLDVADALRFVHAVARARGVDAVLFHHPAAHVVGGVADPALPDLPALRHARRVELV